MAITIHPELEAKLRARAQAAGITIETYIERIARDEEAAEDDIERLALEGLDSGEGIVADDRYWAEKRQRLIDLFSKPGTR
ncbi:MAG: hypothetical protein JST93_17415 [Acidobacteria bacterium]|nr:hypothetical protein [Acidobacteriota bacterium]